MTTVVRRTPPVSGKLTSSEWLAWVRASLINGTGQSADQRQLAVAGDREPVRLIYGEDRVGAQVLNVVPSGVNVLFQCLWCLAGDSVNDVLLGNEPLPAGATVTSYTGTQSSPDAALVAAFATHGITYTDTLAGYMYSVVTMPQAAFTGSLDFTARIKGRICYDPNWNAVKNVGLKNWTASSPGTDNAFNGMDGGQVAIVGVGADDGLPYVDFRVWGTATNVSGAYAFIGFNWYGQSQMFSNAQTVAGQTWGVGAFVKRASGSFPAACAVSVGLQSLDASGVYVGGSVIAAGSAGVIAAPSTRLRSCDYQAAGVLLGGTAGIGVTCGIQVPYNTTLDVTIRIGLPRAWHSSWGDPLRWSNIPAICDADFLVNEEYGCNKRVDYDLVIAASAANTALVGGQYRRILDGLTIPGMQPVKNVAETLRTYAGCFHVPGPNGIQLVPDRPATSVAVYSHAGGTIAGLQRLEKRDTGELPTAVEAIYTDRSMEPWRDASALAERSGAGVTIPYRLQQIRLPGIQRYSQANREAIERLNKLNTTDLALVLDVFDIGIAHELGDVITIADHPAGLSNKEVRISDAPEALGRGLWRLPCVEYDPAAYSDTVASAPTYPDTGLASPAVAPPTLSAFSVSVLADGTRRFAFTVPTGVPRGTRIMVRYVSGSSSTWSAMSHLFSLDYDPNVSAYTFETNEPVGAGTWSFGAKLVTSFGIEAVTASIINGVVLGREPVTYGTAANLLQNADFTDDLGYPLGFYSDARSLRGWTANGNAASYLRNYDNGHRYNFGRGGACVYISSNTVGHYAYLAQTVPFDGANYPDDEFEASVYVLAARANVILYMRFFDGPRTTLIHEYTDSLNTGTGSVGNADAGYVENNYHRLWVKGGLAAIANKTSARWIDVYLLVECTASSSPYPFSAWHKALLCRAPAGVTRATATLWNDSSPSTIHGGQIPVGTVTDVVETTPTDGSQTVTNNGGFPAKATITIGQVSWTNNTPEAVRVVVSFSGLFQYVINAGGISSADISFKGDNNGSIEEVSSLKLSSLGASIYHQASGISRILNVAVGATVQITLYLNFFGVYSGGGQATGYWQSVRLNLQGIRK
jgi:Putative phage tail protein